MAKPAKASSNRLWLQVLALHAIGLPLAILIGYGAYLAAGPVAGAASMVGLSLVVIALGVAHLVRALLKDAR